MGVEDGGMGFDPNQQKEQEKRAKEIVITPDGVIEGDGLDDLEKYLFEKASGIGMSGHNFGHILSKAIAERMGYDYSVSNEEPKEPIRSGATAFSRTDLSRGLPNYEETPSPEEGIVVEFKKVKINLSDDDRQNLSYKVAEKLGHSRPRGEMYPQEIIEQQLGETYYYEVKSDKADLGDLGLVKTFLSHGHSLDSWNSTNEYFNMRTGAAQEMAKRLGYKVEIEE